MEVRRGAGIEVYRASRVSQQGPGRKWYGLLAGTSRQLTSAIWKLAAACHLDGHKNTAWRTFLVTVGLI
jgi:hypothetical protein